MRPNDRALDQLRDTIIETGVSPYAEGSCMIKCGNTHILCAATVDPGVPRWLKGKGKGWVTAEYGMLPRSTHTRMRREATKSGQGGRTMEIQRLIGRSLRAGVDLKALGERQIILDCDVIQADGGTRTASITGAWVALKLAINYLMEEGVLEADPITDQIAAVSCGIVEDTCRLDLEYLEDSAAQTDANFVLSSTGGIIEIQASAEDTPFAANQFTELMRLANKGVGELCAAQLAAIET